jgi:hypothetical protein
MSDFEPDGRDLWRRYRAAALASAAAPPGPAAEPEPGLLAAYVEGRLDEDAAAPVEAWLARDPAALAVVAPVALATDPAPLALIRRARALVGAGAPPVPASWRRAAAWMSIAASLLLVGYTGFLAGHDALDHGEAIASLVGGELIFGPGEGDADGAVF